MSETAEEAVAIPHFRAAEDGDPRSSSDFRPDCRSI